MDKIVLDQASSGIFVERANTALWTITQYSEEPEELDKCMVCGILIESVHYMLCLDTAESCHLSCVTFNS